MVIALTSKRSLFNALLPTQAEPVRVCVTGAAGQIGYSLVYMVGSGAVFGPETPVILHLLDITPMMNVLNGVCMEISDCALPCVRGQFLWHCDLSCPPLPPLSPLIFMLPF